MKKILLIVTFFVLQFTFFDITYANQYINDSIIKSDEYVISSDFKFIYTGFSEFDINKIFVSEEYNTYYDMNNGIIKISKIDDSIEYSYNIISLSTSYSLTSNGSIIYNNSFDISYIDVIITPSFLIYKNSYPPNSINSKFVLLEQSNDGKSLDVIYGEYFNGEGGDTLISTISLYKQKDTSNNYVYWDEEIGSLGVPNGLSIIIQKMDYDALDIDEVIFDNIDQSNLIVNNFEKQIDISYMKDNSVIAGIKDNKLYIQYSGTLKFNKNSYFLFYELQNVKYINGLQYVDTSDVTGMYQMFGHCKNLIELDLSSFDTSNVTYMGLMFSDCESLKSLDLSSFDTSNVTSMRGMFECCFNLTILNLRNFNTSKVESIENMFRFCSNLKELYIPFNTTKINNYNGFLTSVDSIQLIEIKNNEMITNYTSLNLDSFSSYNSEFGLLYRKKIEAELYIYNGNKSEIFTTRFVEYGLEWGILPTPEVPKYYGDGYEFKGWYYENNLIESNTIFNDVSNNTPIILNAKFTIKKYAITFYDSDGTTILGEPIEYEYGTNSENIIIPENINKINYYFGGWYTEKELVNEYDFSGMIFENLNLYAKYIEYDASIVSSSTAINYGEVYHNFSEGIIRKTIIKNNGNISVRLTISNPTSSVPFETSNFENNKVLAPEEEYEVSFILNPHGTNHDVPGTYNGNYIITATAVDGDKQSIVEIQAKVIINKAPMSLSYTTHVQSYGWQEYVNDGEMAGTSGESKRLEAIKIKLNNQDYDGDIIYRTHIQSYGWENEFKKNDEMSGTSGEAKRLEAIEIKLDGEIANHYDIYYRVHAQRYGWLGWAKNGEPSGTAGYGFRLEGIEIKLVEKGTEFDSYGEKEPFKEKKVLYTTHVQSYGWQDYVADGEMAGTSGEAKRLEAIKIKLNNPKYDGDIEYRTHIQSYGWENNFRKNDEMSGTSGESKRLEAIEIKLTGEMAEHYDVYYRVHAQRYGWLAWAKNGEQSGTAGFGFRLEGIEIVLVEKGEEPPVRDNQMNENSFIQNEN